MPDESPRIIRQLIRDHRNMSRLLDVLSEELERSRHTKHVDFEVLSRLVDYILNFPELRHHPREDLIFRRLKRKSPSLLQRTESILAEHKELAELTRRLSAAIRNLWQDIEMPRGQFESLVEKYVAMYRQHMQQEEEIYFPLALMNLLPADWAEIEAEAAVDGTDPLFGGKSDAEYQALHDRILRLAR
ncbi:MAG: hemerythrin domain-containing protein [Rhodospirillaceae bacterium]|nr:hemerythrin domain-containing protein [Rhodospirillaceae bacterium]